MLPSLQDFKDVIEFLLTRHRYDLVREFALTAAPHLPSTQAQDRFCSANLVAEALFKSKYFDEAVVWAERACKADPQNALAAHQLCMCLISALREAEAEPILRSLAQSFPEQVFLNSDLSIALFYQGKFDEAQAILEKTLASLPEDHPHRAVVRFNLHWHWMRSGRFKDSLRAFLSTETKFANLGKPELKPNDDIRGKKVLVLHHDGGAGDEVVNVRFVKYLADRGAKVIWRTHHRLENIFSRVEGMHQVVSRAKYQDPNLLDFDFWISAGSLIQFFDIDLPELSREPYLFADSKHLASWSQKIPARGKLRVGLRWQGTMTTDTEMHRSVPFAEYRKLFDLPNTEFYSLQRDTGLEEILPTDPVVDLSADLKTWEDTAAALTCLDLVITNCTSIAHLSGALGKKTWLYTPLGCFYVWALPGEKAYWYKDVRLFRQSRRRDWAPVTQAVRMALENSLRRSEGTINISTPSSL